MAIAPVQKVVNNAWAPSSPGTESITGVEAGDALICQFGIIGTSMGSATSFTDSTGDTWTKLMQTNQNTAYNSQDNEVWWNPSASAGTHNLSIPFTGTPYGAYGDITITEWSGIEGIDVAAAITTGTSAIATATTATASVAGDLAYVIGIMPLAGGGITDNNTTPWIQANPGAIGQSDSILDYQIMPSTAPVTATWTQYESLGWAAIVILFKPVSGGGGGGGGGVTYPSGFTPPAVPNGYALGGFDDFTGTTLTDLWSGAYNGPLYAESQGIALASHLVLNGDSLLRLEAYPDEANWSNSYEATLAVAEAVNYWCTAGVQTGTLWPVGTIFTWTCKWDTMPGLTPIVLTMGSNWPPEQDLIEAGYTGAQGGPMTSYTSSYLYAAGGGSKVQITISDGGVDFSQWHMWQAKWTATGTKLYCDGVLVGTVTFTTPMTTGAGVNGLNQNMFLALQHETGDPDNPPADGSITSANPITQYFDWVQICTPTRSETDVEALATSLTLSETTHITSVTDSLHATFAASESDIVKVPSTDALLATLTLNESISEVLYQVIFEPNGGLGGMANQQAAEATSLEANTFVLAGYTFAGWNTQANGLGVAYAPGASYPFTSNGILYAQWSINSYTVTFDANTGTGSMAPETEPYNVESTLPLNEFILANANFNGWNTQANGNGDSYADGASYAFTSSVTLYAQWVVTATPDTVPQTSLDWWNQMGPWRDADLAMGLAGDGYPLLTLINSIGSQYAITEAYTRDSPTHIGWSQLLDVNVCPSFALPWLAQFAGVTIPVGATESQMRALIVGQANAKRGTVASLISVLKQFLTGTQLVTIYERDPDPYSFIIVCQASQISGGAGGATAAAALAALIAAKPAGLVMSFIVQSGLTWGEMVDYPASTAGRWADQTDTWASLADDVPVS